MAKQRIHIIEMTKAKDCKGTVKYENRGGDSVLTNIYLERSAYPEMPEKVFIAISDDPIPLKQ